VDSVSGVSHVWCSTWRAVCGFCCMCWLKGRWVFVCFFVWASVRTQYFRRLLSSADPEGVFGVVTHGFCSEGSW